jgi:hypothetical protein
MGNSPFRNYSLRKKFSFCYPPFLPSDAAARSLSFFGIPTLTLFLSQETKYFRNLFDFVADKHFSALFFVPALMHVYPFISTENNVPFLSRSFLLLAEVDQSTCVTRSG